MENRNYRMEPEELPQLLPSSLEIPIQSREELRVIGEELAREFGFKSLDIQMLIDETLDLGMLENDRKKMFDVSSFVHLQLALGFVDICESFSIKTGFCIFADVANSSLFLDDCLLFS